MSYTLEAIFSTQGTLEKFKGAYKNISIVSLPQGFEMIPLTYDLQQEMYGYEPEGTDYEDDDIGVPAAALATS